MKWYNPTGYNQRTMSDDGEWETVSDETYHAGSPACVTVTINQTSQPDIQQLGGTVFSAVVAAGPPPTLTALSPNKGTAAGGTVVTLTGTGFEGVSAVKFGTVTARKVTYDSPTEITAESPEQAPETVAIYVTTPNGTSTAGKKDKFKIKAVKTKKSKKSKK